jgi:uncharacterized membrane protein HdeD (DUF308 family)
MEEYKKKYLEMQLLNNKGNRFVGYIFVVFGIMFFYVLFLEYHFYTLILGIILIFYGLFKIIVLTKEIKKIKEELNE